MSSSTWMPPSIPSRTRNLAAATDDDKREVDTTTEEYRHYLQGSGYSVAFLKHCREVALGDGTSKVIVLDAGQPRDDIHTKIVAALQL